MDDELALLGELEPPFGVLLTLELAPPLLELVLPLALVLATVVAPPFVATLVEFDALAPPLEVELLFELALPPDASTPLLLELPGLLLEPPELGW